jgi:hypothetical protein
MKEYGDRRKAIFDRVADERLAEYQRVRLVRWVYEEASKGRAKKERGHEDKDKNCTAPNNDWVYIPGSAKGRPLSEVGDTERSFGELPNGAGGWLHVHAREASATERNYDHSRVEYELRCEFRRTATYSAAHVDSDVKAVEERASAEAKKK